ncbi:hypothetical protein AGMMS49579_22100 [Spirochaetia bacterium]|nr:hypothetical protein AGMMS49579_22100 [Spirochaetia bacterium]
MKTPRFFCDNCGAEVDRDTKTCPKCGRFFASIRCPKCGFTGTEGAFTFGCPICGYSAGEAPTGLSPEKSPGKGAFPIKKNQTEPEGALPVWVYIITTLAAIGVFGILVRFLK